MRGKRATPFDLLVFFSIAVGVGTVVLTHSHKVTKLIGMNAIWLAYLGLIYWHARSNQGKLLNIPAGFLYGTAVSSYLVGLLLCGVYYIVYGGN
jgi:hypothetical protein